MSTAKAKNLLIVLCIALIVLVTNVFAAEKNITILALGDSTTAGNPGFLSPVENPPDGKGNEQSQYAYWIMKKHPEWKVLNRGVSAERIDQIYERFKTYVKSEKPAMVIVLAGVNDLYVGDTAEQVKEKLRKIYALAVEKKIRVLACTILPYDSSGPQVKQRMHEVNRWIKENAAAQNFLFSDTFQAVNHTERYGKLSGTPDGMHPDVEGYREIGETLARVIEKVNETA